MKSPDVSALESRPPPRRAYDTDPEQSYPVSFHCPCPPPYLYGMWAMRFAAAMIRWTIAGPEPRWRIPPRRFSTVVVPGCPSAAHVAGPATPSTARPCRRWKRRTARAVAGPKTPSAVTPTERCRRRTSARRDSPRPLADRRAVWLRRSARHVAGPTTPSAVNPCRCWKRRTARRVVGPKTPSLLRPSQRWTFATAGPRDPRLSAASEVPTQANSASSTAARRVAEVLGIVAGAYEVS